MKYQKIILPSILISSSLLILYGLKNQFFSQTKTDSNSSNQSSSSVKTQDESNSNLVYQKLSVLSNRCRGCGKCTRIDSQHFEMSNGIAIVTSSTNLNSSNLTLAINNCPSQAIVLE